jgi:hypothetical protein
MALFCAHTFVATSMLEQLLRAAQSGCDAEFHALRKAVGALMLTAKDWLQAVQASRVFERAGLQATLVLCRRRHGWQAHAGWQTGDGGGRFGSRTMLEVTLHFEEAEVTLWKSANRTHLYDPEYLEPGEEADRTATLVIGCDSPFFTPAQHALPWLENPGGVTLRIRDTETCCEIVADFAHDSSEHDPARALNRHHFHCESGNFLGLSIQTTAVVSNRSPMWADICFRTAKEGNSSLSVIELITL